MERRCCLWNKSQDYTVKCSWRFQHQCREFFIELCTMPLADTLWFGDVDWTVCLSLACHSPKHLNTKHKDLFHCLCMYMRTCSYKCLIWGVILCACVYHMCLPTYVKCEYAYMCIESRYIYVYVCVCLYDCVCLYVCMHLPL